MYPINIYILKPPPHLCPQVSFPFEHFSFGVSSNEVCSGEIIAPAANRPKEGRISFHVESMPPGVSQKWLCGAEA